MRVNQYLAAATGMSRRQADEAVSAGEVLINDTVARLGSRVNLPEDAVRLKGKLLHLPKQQTIMLHKPRGYVCSRSGQGNKTIYELLPNNLHRLKPVGRLDKDSSGLFLLTNNGELAQKLTHPEFEKTKRYLVTLNRPISADDMKAITHVGIKLDDGMSKLLIDTTADKQNMLIVTMTEGRNRQIRRTFAALGYKVTSLHRTHFGPYSLGKLSTGNWIFV